jgi:uncharacterized membrane protein YkoI
MKKAVSILRIGQKDFNHKGRRRWVVLSQDSGMERIMNEKSTKKNYAIWIVVGAIGLVILLAATVLVTSVLSKAAWDRDRSPSTLESLNGASSTNSGLPADSNGTNAQGTQTVSVDQAKNIALEHAGLSADQVDFVKAQGGYDDGIYEYEIEFLADGWEYEYTVHGDTGAILETDQDRLDLIG